MHESLEDLKRWLIHEISDSDNQTLLYDLKNQVVQYKQRYVHAPTSAEAEAALFALAAEPDAPYALDLEEIMREQGFVEPDEEKILRLIQEMDVQEPVEELLAFLS